MIDAADRTLSAEGRAMIADRRGGSASRTTHAATGDGWAPASA
jgi:hypothetical protein